jgi:hypothetical protein
MGASRFEGKGKRKTWSYFTWCGYLFYTHLVGLLVMSVTLSSAILRRVIAERYHCTTSQALPKFLVAFNGSEKILNITKSRLSFWELCHLLQRKRKE